MAVLTDYKGLDVVEDSTGSGGVALTDNFKELADRAPYQAATNPGTGDDSTKGFSPGEFWMNTSTQVLWSCVSNNTGAAVWKSVLKRTATGLELIPSESSDTVQVNGQARVNGKLGVGRTATTNPIEVQQPAHGIGLKIFGSGTQANESGQVNVDTNGQTFLVASKDIYLSPTLGTTNLFGTRLAIRSGRYITFDNTAGTTPQYSMGTNTSNGKLIIGTGNGLGTPRLTMDPTTNFVGVNTDSPASTLDVNGDKIRLRSSKTPSSASDTGNQGEVCWDANYVYICVSANTWKRAALGSW